MSQTENKKITLSPADAAIVDRVLGGERDGTPSDPAREGRIGDWLNVLDKAPGGDPKADLLARTLSAIANADRMKMPEPAARAAGAAAEAAPRSLWRRRLAEYGAMAVAASLLVAVVLMGMNQVRHAQARVACVNNLKALAGGFSAYAGANSGQLPMIAMPSNHNWLRGSADGARSNAAHLLAMVDAGYVPVGALFCKGAGVPEPGTAPSHGNDLPPIGYSYRNLYGTDKPAWDGHSSTLILVDRNPVLAVPGRTGMEDKNSENHDGKGENVLLADGTVSWFTNPNIGPGHDNIWTIGAGTQRLTRYSGTEVPASVTDVFVCP